MVELEILREDVRQYIETIALPEIQEQLRNRHRLSSQELWKLYEKYKQEISNICGYDSPDGNFSQRDYNNAVSFLVDLLKI